MVDGRWWVGTVDGGRWMGVVEAALWGDVGDGCGVGSNLVK